MRPQGPPGTRQLGCGPPRCTYTSPGAPATSDLSHLAAQKLWHNAASPAWGACPLGLSETFEAGSRDAPGGACGLDRKPRGPANTERCAGGAMKRQGRLAQLGVKKRETSLKAPWGCGASGPTLGGPAGHLPVRRHEFSTSTSMDRRAEQTPSLGDQYSAGLYRCSSLLRAVRVTS